MSGAAGSSTPAGGWSTILRWEGVKRTDAAARIEHDCRDVDLELGRGVRPSNPDVDPARTRDNVTMVTDGNGGFIPCTGGSAQWLEILDAHIVAAPKNIRRHRVRAKDPATGKMVETGEVREVEVGLRKDADVAIEVILQLDPLFTGTGRVYDDDGNPTEVIRTVADMTPARKAETRRLLNVMVDEVIADAGAENVIGWSEHWDEVSPGIQLIYVPRTDDGRINAKEVLTRGQAGKAAAQKAYADRHDAMRTRLRTAGYKATMVRVHDGKRHLGIVAYKREMDRQLREQTELQQILDNLRHDLAQLDTDQAEFEDKKVDAYAKYGDLILEHNQRADAFAAKVKASQAEYHRLKADLDEHHASLDQREADLAEEERALRGYARAVKDHNTAKIDQAIRRATDTDLGHWLQQHHPDLHQQYLAERAGALAPAPPQMLRGLKRMSGKDLISRELLVVDPHIRRTPGGRVWLDIELRATDPAASSQRGLHAVVNTTSDGRPHPFETYSPAQFQMIQEAAGTNRHTDQHGDIYAVNADLLRPSTGDRYVLATQTLKATPDQVTPDWFDQQRAAEEKAQERSRGNPPRSSGAKTDDPAREQDGTELE